MGSKNVLVLQNPNITIYITHSIWHNNIMVQMVEILVFSIGVLCVYRGNGCAARGPAVLVHIDADEVHFSTRQKCERNQ